MSTNSRRLGFVLPAIGSVRTLAEQGRFGVVVGAQPVGEAKDGRQLVALKVEAESEGQDSAAHSPTPVSSVAGLGGSGNEPQPINDSSRTANLAARLPAELLAAEKADVTRLQQRDQQVRQEEKAHAAVAGDLAGPINYIYQRGPDGRQYAVGGSVSIQASVLSGDPAEAQRKAGRIAAAANAATNPSAQDFATARQAYAFGSQLGQSPPVEERSPGLSFTL
ncbi:MAG: putative metalloprotease CJM1_0395 family protein [Geminicoccaceae bacterium]